MTATERLVELYYRQQGYFTRTDEKIIGGNNRQLDLLALKPSSFAGGKSEFLHVEIQVAGGLNWAPNSHHGFIRERMRLKFFGFVPNKEKNYISAINETYRRLGLNFNDVVRVWCSWHIKDFSKERELELIDGLIAEYSQFNLKRENFKFLNFRDQVLKTLLENIGTSNYDDDLFRTLSLIKEGHYQLKQIKQAGLLP